MAPIEAILTVPWLVLLVYWILSARGNKRSEYQINPIWTWSPAVGLLAIFLFSRSRPELFNRPVFTVSPIGKALGATFCLAGVALAIWARRILGTNWSANPAIKEGHELVKVGPYRCIRHPIYSGVLLGVLGECLADGTVRNLLCFSFLLGIALLKLRSEESLMLRRFPQTYLEYKKHTKRLIPFVV